MEYTKLGQTDLIVSPVAFGTSPLGGMFGPLTEADAINLVHEVIDLGINFIDSSRYYQSAEERLGKAIKGKRHEVVLGTKAGRYGFADFDFSAAGVRRGIEESLRLLGTDYVDILQLHDIEFAPLDAVLPGTAFGPEYGDWVRMSLATRREDIAAAAALLQQHYAAVRVP